MITRTPVFVIRLSAVLWLYSVQPFDVAAQALSPRQPEKPTYSFDFRDSSLIDALERLVKETGLNIIYTSDMVSTKYTQCHAEALEAAQVLHCILENSGLLAEQHPSGAFILKVAPETKQQKDTTAAVLGQKSISYTISGFITDEENGERLIGANVYVTNQRVGAVTNAYGFYSLTLPADSIYLQVSFVGFQSQFFALHLTQDLKLDFTLTSEAIGLDTVEVTATRSDNTLESTQMSTVALPLTQVKQLPTLLGETDVIKALQLLPGVQSGSEGSSGLYVRGGGPDQNLILLDGAPVYNASHIFGFVSVFNADALQHVQLTKGGFPARYGGRLSSVLDISMKEGNLKRFEVDGAIGLVFSKLTVQGPLIKDRMSFILSGRRTYIDVLTRPFSDNVPDAFNFGDLNAKLNYIASPRSRLYLSFYTGRDAFGDTTNEDADTFTSEMVNIALDWGNATSTLRWNYLISDKLFANTTLTYSRYNFDVAIQVDDGLESEVKTTSTTYLSGIKDVSAKIDVDYLPTPNHAIRFGGLVVRHRFTPGVGRFNERLEQARNTFKFTPDSTRFSGLEFNGYLEDDWRISSRLKTNLGLHVSGMHVENTFYGAVQPRFSTRFLLRDNWSTKASFSMMQQYLHLLTNTGIGLPTDLWVAATKRIPPQKAWQTALGVTHLHGNGDWEFSIEGYYKRLHNLIEYQSGAAFLGRSENWQDKVTMGDGWAYGGELFIQKKHGRTTGWLGYTLSWTERQFDALNDGDRFPYRYDRRHDISLVLTHRLTERWDLGATWVYGSGNAITLATARFHDPNPLLPAQRSMSYYGKRNSFRMRPYHRLDLSLVWNRARHTWAFSIYNAYNRQNPFFYFEDTVNEQSVYKQINLFPIIPSVTWSFSI